MNLLSATELFMEKGGQLEADPRNNWNDLEHRQFRVNLLKDEFKEYLDAIEAGDLVEATDGLLDIIVVAWGNLLDSLGPAKARAAEYEVFSTNLAKVIGPGLPIFREDGKILKPEGWKPPDIASIVNS